MRVTIDEWNQIITAIEVADKVDGHGNFDYILFKAKMVRDKELATQAHTVVRIGNERT